MKILNLSLYSKNIYRFANTKQNFINFKSNDLKQDTFESKQGENDNLICKKSKYYIDPSNNEPYEIPASYLQKLGFSNVKTLRKLVQAEILDGRIERKETPQGTKFKTSIIVKNTSCVPILRKLREEYGALTYVQLSKELGVTRNFIKDSIAKGELEIIPEYILVGDDKDLWIDTKNPKNKDYINKRLIEHEIMNQFKEEGIIKRREKMNERAILWNLIMQLAWNHFKEENQTGIDYSKHDSYLKYIQNKGFDENNLDFAQEENIEAFRKNFWKIAQTKEFKEGIKEADKTINKYNNSGIDSIDDEEIRKILIEYGLN